MKVFEMMRFRNMCGIRRVDSTKNSLIWRVIRSGETTEKVEG